MPSVVQTQTMDRVSYMLAKDRHSETPTAVFASVNARQAPPSPPRLNVPAYNAMAENAHVRPYSQSNSEPSRDQNWHSATRQPENGRYPASPPLEEGERSSPKRKRASPDEDARSSGSPSSPPEPTRPRMGSSMSPPQGEPVSVDQHQRTLPPMNVIDHGRPWGARDSQTGSLEVQYRDPQGSSAMAPAQADGVTKVEHVSQGIEVSSTTETTRAGVQVDPKLKRKRQFAHRTKTGCGTCRRRKKKCDEAKPYCTNCSRGGFICEGYPKRVQYVKNGVTRTPPALQAREHHQLDSPQLYHSHGAPREAYSENGSVDGARNRPIVLDEHESQQASRSTWSNMSEQGRSSHVPEPSQSQDYVHPPPAVNNLPPNEHYVQHNAAPPPPPPQRHRIYHHTQQTMGQVVNNTPGVASESQPHPPPLQVYQPHSSGGPPPPSHYSAAPAHRRERSEKEKMLAGEPFSAYHHTLITEREHCSKAVYRFNMTCNDHVQITSEEKQRHFQAVVAAKWVHRTEMDMHYRGLPLAGHVGKETFVDAPFHCDYGYNLVIHDSVTIGPGCKFLDSGKITIGRNSRISANVTIDTQRVPMDSKSVKGSRGTVVAAEVSIGENVYIGAGAIILAGVKIGTGAIIHPGSVVMKDIPRDCIARGNPANVSAVNWED